MVSLLDDSSATGSSTAVSDGVVAPAPVLSGGAEPVDCSDVPDVDVVDVAACLPSPEESRPEAGEPVDSAVLERIPDVDVGVARGSLPSSEDEVGAEAGEPDDDSDVFDDGPEAVRLDADGALAAPPEDPLSELLDAPPDDDPPALLDDDEAPPESVPSACAIPAPLAIAAPSPNVTAPAPSHE